MQSEFDCCKNSFKTVTSPSFRPNPAPSILRSCNLVFSSLGSDYGTLLSVELMARQKFH